MAVNAQSRLDRLKTIGDRRHELMDQLEDVRSALAHEIYAAVDDGIRQVDIVKATGYTREQIRLITLGRAES